MFVTSPFNMTFENPIDLIKRGNSIFIASPFMLFTSHELRYIGTALEVCENGYMCGLICEMGERKYKNYVTNEFTENKADDSFMSLLASNGIMIDQECYIYKHID